MAEYLPAIDWVIDNHEGGFQNIASDPGNWYGGELLGTIWGVSAPTARGAGWTGRMQDMPREWAISNVYPSFWSGLDGVQDQGIATKILDMRLSGPRRADRYVQQGLIHLGWRISADGIIGPLTLSAINQETRKILMDVLATQQEQLYRDSYAKNPIGTNWLTVWLNRASDIPVFAILATGLSLGALVLAGLLIYAVVSA